MARVVELMFKGDNRSAVRALSEIASQSEKTSKQIKGDADESSASFDKVRKSSTLLRDAVSGLAGMIGLGGLAFGLKDAVQGGIQLQSSQAQLRAALRGTTTDAKGATDSLTKYAESLSTHGGFSTSQNITALTAFVRETHSATTAQQGLALATNIARGRNIDLASAQMTVQRAYGGSIGRLQALLGPMVAVKDASVNLTTAHQKEIAAIQQQAAMMTGPYKQAYIANADIADHITAQQQALATLSDKNATAQEVIQAAQRVFGGATGAYAGTTQGKISDLQNSLKNLADETGMHLLPMVNRLAGFLSVVANLFSKLSPGLQAGIVGLTGLGLIAGPLTKALGLLRGAAVLAAGGEKTAGAAGVEEAAGETAGGAGGGGAGLMAALGAGGLRATALRSLLGVGAGALAASQLRALTGVGNVHGKSSGVGSAIGTGLGGLIGGGLGALSFTPFGIALGAGAGAGLGNLLGGFLGGHAAGGYIGQSGVALVGESGPELVALPGGSSVMSNSQSQQMMAPQIVQIRLDSRVLAEAVIKYSLNRAARGPSSLVGGSLVTGAAGLPA